MTTKPIPERFKPGEIEVKWQRFWERVKLYTPDLKNAKNPYYNLMMFPYPSAEGLHIGNMYAFTGVDIHGRFMRMKGFDVFEPMGLDGFGIHSENYALKVGRTPQEHARLSQENFYRQLHQIGNGYDWSKSLETYDPDYYRWTQWLFVQMFKHGLAYRAKAAVNYCPGCKTVLADEQVIDGKCERCSSMVEEKELEQWFFRITKYAERLLQNTYKPTFNWSKNVKLGQRKWIGKKEGINIKYKISNFKYQIEVFTTTPVNFAATFLVISPEHPLVSKISSPEQKDAVNKYIDIVKQMKKEDRIAQGREKTGVFTGAYAINHVTNESIPIWVSDFVLMDVGTGAIQACPGHDMRDFEFAMKFGMPIKRVVVGPESDTSPIEKAEQVIESGMPGIMVNSDFLNGLEFKDAMVKTMDYFEAKGWGKRVITYHLRDWLISRQRYWGAPIPMIYCKKCADKGLSWFDTEESSKMSVKQARNDNKMMVGWFPVPEDQLPVLLPEVKDWKPTGTGRGPLAGHPEFYQTKCPNCGSPADRETDVCDTFLDSSWYFLRYPSVGIQNAKINPPAGGQNDNSKLKIENSLEIENWKLEIPWDSEITSRWIPVHSYIGGAEHTVLHLLYTRFVWMALRDWGYLKVEQVDKSRAPSGSVEKGETKTPFSTSSTFTTFSTKESTSISFDPDEPFRRFFAHGLIIKDGAKMSKSKGNVVVPDDYIKLYGADTLRTYLMFLGPFDGGGDFRDSGIQGMYRWLSRVWRLSQSQKSPPKADQPLAEKVPAEQDLASPVKSQKSEEGTKLLHKTIKAVTEDIEELHYNTAIARLMEFTNWWMDHEDEISLHEVLAFLKLLAPFAPHMTEELYQLLVGELKIEPLIRSKTNNWSIHTQSWPTYDVKLIEEDMVTVIVQINGKMRDSFTMAVQSAKDQHQVEQLSKSSAKARKWLQDKKIIKTVFVSGKLINFVV